MIFYFSGTGNTKWAVEKLAEKTGDEVVFLPDVANKSYHLKLKPGERLGFCFPVHGWRPPTLVRKFIEQLTVENIEDSYVYSLVTAGDNIGETIDILRNDLKERNIPLHSSCSLIMPESYVGLPFMDVDTKEKEQLKISNADKKLEKFIDIVLQRATSNEDLDIGNWPRINSRIIGGFFHKYLVSDKPFHITEDKCLHCGKCAKVCSVDNIIWHEGESPSWKQDGTCMACFNCYHHCPTHAIEYGSRTKHKGQYYFGKNKA